MEELTVQIGQWGKITSGQYAGWHILVEPGDDGSGFLVFLSVTFGEKDGYDSWFQNLEGVKSHVRELAMQIVWPPS